jgi:glucokinase
VTFINRPWSFSQAALKSRFKLDRLLVVNDFAALSAGVPHLAPGDLRWIGGGQVSVAYAPKTIIGVLGPGTGLGVGRVVPIDGHWLAASGEGGHASLAATTDRESDVLTVMRRHFGHVSAERALSGAGLVNLYSALAELDGATPQALVPQQVTEMAISGSDPHCREALGMFAEMLGTVAGNLALAFGTKGGIYIGGGIVPRLGFAFPAQRFRRRFEQKGRLSPYIADIPSFIICHPFPAFVGLAAILRNVSRLAVGLV